MHTDRFTPLDAATLLRWMRHDLRNGQLFGIDRRLFFMPKPDDPFRWKRPSASPPDRMPSSPRTSCPHGCAARGTSNSRPYRCSTS